MHDFPANLRDSIQPMHDAIEQLPITKQIAAGIVSRTDYLELLAQLHGLHQVLEPLLASHSYNVYDAETMARTTALERDITQLGGTLSRSLTSETTLLTQLFQDWAEHSPWKLLGALYILEGSRMGSRFLVKQVARAMDVPIEPHQGLDYHLELSQERPKLWPVFKANLAAAPLSDEQKEDVTAAALETMKRLCGVYGALLPDHASPVRMA